MEIDRDNLDDIRDATCQNLLDAIAPFCAIDDDEILSAVVSAALYGADNHTMDEKDLMQFAAWAKSIHTQVVMMQLVLSGGVYLRIENGTIAFKLADPDEAMRQFVRKGIAKPSTESASAPPATPGD